jgi:N-carbamoyl-L-amino-acid hydrolase
VSPRTIEPEIGAIESSIDALAGIVDDSQEGWTRQVFSDPYRASRSVVAERMREVGLDVHVDGGGNIIGHLHGASSQRASLKPLMTGSHTDTVRAGGRYDGVVGVLGAIEAVAAMRRSGVQLQRDLYVVDFLGEEPNEFGVSCVGSRSIAGLLTPEHLDLPGTSGATLGGTMQRFGLDTEAALQNAWQPDSLHAYIELHIEQGPLLERSGDEIGIVTAIAGIDRLMARFSGRQDHAGATPMDARMDALTAAAQAILTIEREGCGAPVHGVATTGRIESYPGSFNVVPSEATLWAELRSTDSQWLGGVKGRLAKEIGLDAERRGVGLMIEWLTDQDAVPTSPAIRDLIGRSADKLGYSWKPVPSGAGHDAAHLAHLGPMGMIFIPSVGGRSHAPEEFTPTADIVRGIDVLVDVLTELDRAAALLA